MKKDFSIKKVREKFSKEYEDFYHWSRDLKRDMKDTERKEKLYCLKDNSLDAYESISSDIKDFLEPHKISTRWGVAGFVAGGAASGTGSYKLGEWSGEKFLEYGGGSSEELLPIAVGVGSTAFIFGSLYFGYRTGKIATLCEELWKGKEKVSHIDLKESYEEIKEEFD